MIQRLQSVYLLLVTVLMSLFLVMSYAEISLGDNEVIRFYCFAIQKHLDDEKTELVRRTLPLVVMVLLSGMTSFVNIFLHRKRPLQMRICVLTSVVLIAQLGLSYFYYSGFKSDYGQDQASFTLSAIFPVVCIILLMMAYRSIRHDETLVQSYNRIR